jgi:hypothetical protein
MVKPIRIIVLAALALAAVIAATPAQAAIKHYDGVVRAVDAKASTFKIRTEDGARAKFRVNRSTEFERIAGGFDGLKRGLAVEVDAKRTANGLLAREVETRRADGDGGDNEGPGGDHGDDD